MHADIEKTMSHFDSDSSIHVATADCETNSRQPGTGKSLCNHFNLPYYPYIIYGTNGQKKGEYNGDRSYTDMVNFINRHAVSEETSDDVATQQPICEKDSVQV